MLKIYGKFLKLVRDEAQKNPKTLLLSDFLQSRCRIIDSAAFVEHWWG